MLRDSMSAIARWWFRPRAVFALAALWLTIDFLSLPETAGVRMMLETAAAGGSRAHRSAWHESAWIVRRDGVLQLSIDYDEENPPFVGVVGAFPSQRLRGWWAPTTESFRADLLTTSETPLSVAEWREVREMFAAHLETLGYDHMDEYAQWVRESRTSIARPLPSGYVRNALALLAAFIVLLGCGDWILASIVDARARRAMRSGLCPKCRYDLQGDVAAGCPECGWHRNATSSDKRP